MSRVKIEYPTEEEDRLITEDALRDPDNPPLTDADFARMTRVRGPQKSPTKAQVTIRLDADVIERLRSGGRGWQTRANALLRQALGL